MEYIAFGEVLFEEHSSSFSLPYLFNGKELDRETNLSYYGARYLDMKTSLWLSVDPLAEEFPDVSPYNYCLSNPLRLIDPTGMAPQESDPPTKQLPEITVSRTVNKKQDKHTSVTLKKIEQPKVLTGYPGQGLDELVTAGIQWLGEKISGSDVSKETSENVQFATSLAIVIVSKGKNAKADEEVAEQITKKGKDLVEQGADLVKKNGGKNSVTIETATQKIRYDLAGKAHGGVPTPHMQVYNKNFVDGVQKSVSRATRDAIPMLQKDIRLIRKYLEKK
ncbi:RHS repeat-associated core domain-containing protein [Flavobacterium columnare]|uniref:RHS repeat-associated core domain-containing protein n=1 Tax=Flavobacterium columnare TaxID=996 RepID=UPI002D7A1756|nr:RHS repeat-associated core domain-containing protein [Flavobacterium columnare]